MANSKKKEKDDGPKDGDVVVDDGNTVDLSNYVSKDDVQKLIEDGIAKGMRQVTQMAREQPPAASLDLSGLAESMVRAETRVREEAVVINKEAHTRSQQRKEIESALLKHDDQITKPYLLYSMENCPHTAPTVGGHDFPKYILKKQGKNRPDLAAKKVAWLTDREVARIHAFAQFKFMKLPSTDDDGNPVVDPRTNAAVMKPVPYSTFIRVVPTVQVQGRDAVDDPGVLLAAQDDEIKRLTAELAAFKAQAGEAKVPQANVHHGTKELEDGEADLGEVNDELAKFKENAIAGEAEAKERGTAKDKNKQPV